MSDYISRAEVHKTLSLLATEGGTDAKMLLADAHEFIDALPSADAISREEYEDIIKDYRKQYENMNNEIADLETKLSADAVHGEWKAHRVSLDFICSNCGEACWSDFDYCPHCGARMTPHKGGDTE